MDVIIGLDPHKSSHTAVAIDATEQVLDQLRLVAGRRQIDQLLAFAERWPDRRWAVEGASGLGRLVAQQLVRADEQVIDVPAALSARVRLLSGGSARKTDSQDARSEIKEGLLKLVDEAVAAGWTHVRATSVLKGTRSARSSSTSALPTRSWRSPPGNLPFNRPPRQALPPPTTGSTTPRSPMAA